MWDPASGIKYFSEAGLNNDYIMTNAVKTDCVWDFTQENRPKDMVKKFKKVLDSKTLKTNISAHRDHTFKVKDKIKKEGLELKRARQEIEERMGKLQEAIGYLNRIRNDFSEAYRQSLADKKVLIPEPDNRAITAEYNLFGVYPQALLELMRTFESERAMMHLERKNLIAEKGKYDAFKQTIKEEIERIENDSQIISKEIRRIAVVEQSYEEEFNAYDKINDEIQERKNNLKQLERNHAIDKAEVTQLIQKVKAEEAQNAIMKERLLEFQENLNVSIKQLGLKKEAYQAQADKLDPILQKYDADRQALQLFKDRLAEDYEKFSVEQKAMEMTKKIFMMQYEKVEQERANLAMMVENAKTERENYEYEQQLIYEELNQSPQQKELQVLQQTKNSTIEERQRIEKEINEVRAEKQKLEIAASKLADNIPRPHAKQSALAVLSKPRIRSPSPARYTIGDGMPIRIGKRRRMKLPKEAEAEFDLHFDSQLDHMIPDVMAFAKNPAPATNFDSDEEPHGAIISGFGDFASTTDTEAGGFQQDGFIGPGGLSVVLPKAAAPDAPPQAVTVKLPTKGREEFRMAIGTGQKIDEVNRGPQFPAYPEMSSASFASTTMEEFLEEQKEREKRRKDAPSKIDSISSSSSGSSGKLRRSKSQKPRQKNKAKPAKGKAPQLQAQEEERAQPTKQSQSQSQRKEERSQIEVPVGPPNLTHLENTAGALARRHRLDAALEEHRVQNPLEFREAYLHKMGIRETPVEDHAPKRRPKRSKEKRAQSIALIEALPRRRPRNNQSPVARPPLRPIMELTSSVYTEEGESESNLTSEVPTMPIRVIPEDFRTDTKSQDSN